MSVIAPARSCLRGLVRDCRGLALIEFAYVMPFFLILMGGGVELTNFATANMRVSQIAISLADNASRAKQEAVSGVPHMREVDVNEVFQAAQMQSGGLDLARNGRMILSSLEVNPLGGQWIHWQRCSGAANHVSSFGVEGLGANLIELTGLGPAGRQVSAEPGTAIMFVEVIYDYEPVLFGNYFKAGAIRKTAAMYVRDDRDLSGLFNPAPAVAVSSCDT